MNEESTATNQRKEGSESGIHVVAKPTGSVCNMRCDYCFYLEKQNLYTKSNHRMPDQVLREFTRNYIESQPTPEVEFVWQGGEPTIRGIDFFRRAVEYQKPFRASKTIKNSLQTNGTLLTDEWCEFFKQNGFLVGLSLDGPREIHDRYRSERGGHPTFDMVMKGLKLLRRHGVEFNVLACVARETAYRPLEVYRFFKDEGVQFVQFTPIVERVAGEYSRNHGFHLAGPSALDREETNIRVTPWTVEPEKYGDFLISVFDEWVRRDVGNVFIMNFEWALNAWVGEPSPICVFSRRCGRAVAVENNGDVYACDHYVYPEYRLGNINEDDLRSMVDASVNSGFGAHKEAKLPRWCRECEVLQACWGGCPKHRFCKSPYEEPGLHYLCAGYKKFFRHSAKYMTAFRRLIELDLPPEYIMQAIGRPLLIPASAQTGHREVVLWIKENG